MALTCLPKPKGPLLETPETSASPLMLLHPFPIHPLLCSVPPPPLPFQPQRVLSSDRTVNHTLSAGLILCVCICVCVCVCVCVCPDVHLHFQQDRGSVFLSSIFCFFFFFFALFSTFFCLPFISHILFMWVLKTLVHKGKDRFQFITSNTWPCLLFGKFLS